MVVLAEAQGCKMTTALLLLAGIGIPALSWLVLHFVKQAAKANERADYNEATAKEVVKQSDNLLEHITDDDVVRLLTKKAADKRKRETEGKR